LSAELTSNIRFYSVTVPSEKTIIFWKGFVCLKMEILCKDTLKSVRGGLLPQFRPLFRGALKRAPRNVRDLRRCAGLT
jgi:hypothetical protein